MSAHLAAPSGSVQRFEGAMHASAESRKQREGEEKMLAELCGRLMLVLVILRLMPTRSPSGLYDRALPRASLMDASGAGVQFDLKIRRAACQLVPSNGLTPQKVMVSFNRKVADRTSLSTSPRSSGPG